MFLEAEEIFAKAQEDIFGISAKTVGISKEDIEKIRVHGTTCLAVVNQVGVIVAADGRATLGNYIGTEHFNKLFNLDPYTVIAISGSAGVAQNMAGLLKARFMFDFDRNEGAYIPPKSKVKIISQMIHRNIGPALTMGMVVMPIVAIYDDDRSDPGGRVFIIMADGTEFHSQYGVVGSGTPHAKATFETKLSDIIGISKDRLSTVPLKHSLTIEKAKELAVYSLLSANLSDNATGPHLRMKQISSNGISMIPQEEVVELVKKIKTDGGMR